MIIELIELIGGPLDGEIHKVASGHDIPEAVSYTDKQTGSRHCYDVTDGVGYFVRTDKGESCPAK